MRGSLERKAADSVPTQRRFAPAGPQRAERATIVMKMLGFMMVMSVVGVLILAVSRNVDMTFLSSSNLESSNVRAPSNAPDEVAFEKIKREDSTGRFPFLVSTLCRQFLELHSASSRRPEVEEILQRNQAKIAEPERPPSPEKPGVGASGPN